MFYGEDAEIKVLEGQNKVLSAMYDEEKSYPEKLTKDKKKEICEVSQTEQADVKDVIDKFEQLFGFHKFLIKRRDRGEPMPDTQDELFDIYRYERPAFLTDTGSEKQKYSNKQRNRLFFRSYT